MRYLVTRSNNRFPDVPQVLENNVWYNIYSVRSAPYNIINVNDELIIQATNNRHFNARFATLIKHQFASRDLLLTILENFGYSEFENDPYWTSKLDIQSGFLLAYKFNNINEYNIQNELDNLIPYGTGFSLINL